MESLSPECTPLKHRYDSCFNAWFEGYLQPALAASTSTSAFTSTSTSSSSSSISSTPTSTSESTNSTSPSIAPPTPNVPGTKEPRQPIITSWSKSFPSKRLFPLRKPSHKVDLNATPNQAGGGGGVEQPEHHWYDFALSEEDDTELEVISPQAVEVGGKTRSQIKAEEYERNCGKFWLDYQGCLKNAIQQNESLSTLLETAREEHPLGSLDGLKGTPWDSNKDFTKEQE